MPELAIIARPVLGGLQGHRDHGERAPIPDPARLFSALVHAAGTGSSAVERDGDLRISAAAERALRWLEEHPPTAMSIPPFLNEPKGVRAFRDEGVLEGAKAPTSRKVNKEQADFTAFAAPLGWAWQEDAPEGVVETVRVLCEDVSCLGEADTPVVLEVGSIEPTHILADDHSGFPAPGGPGRHELRGVQEGRLDALEAQYAEMNPVKRPSASQDKSSWTAKPRAVTPTQGGLVRSTYRSIEPVVPDLPWVSGFALRCASPISETERVQWAVTLHRALATRLGDGAPSVVTGAYAPGAPRPANRVALHYVSGPTVREDLRAGGFVAMLPQGIEPADALSVREVLRAGIRVYRGAAGERFLTYAGEIEPENFWLPRLPGMTRMWHPAPALMPEMRRPKGDDTWTLADSALVSVGMTFRDRLDIGNRLRGEARYRAMRDAVETWGVKAHDVRRIADSRVERYVHKLPKDLVAQPLHAVLDMHPVMGEQALVAVGQSRHLGGGLLQPHDVPEGRYGS